MIDPNNPPSVEADEVVARYVMQRRHVRANKTVKPDAFLPHPHRELSVTRHRETDEEELWTIGKQVAAQRAKPLMGRADIEVAACETQGLPVKAAPLPENPNHANVTGWPREKHEQKDRAMELANRAIFTQYPE